MSITAPDRDLNPTPSGPFEARVIDDMGNFIFGHLVRLVVWQERHDGYWDVMMGDGTWKRIPNDTVSEEPPGLLLPAAAVESLALAIERWQGKANHGATEVKVLREWLEVERRRVDVLVSLQPREQ